MLKFIKRFLEDDEAEVVKETLTENHMKMDRVAAEIENQDIRLSLTPELIRRNLNAAERLVWAINRDRTR